MKCVFCVGSGGRAIVLAMMAAVSLWAGAGLAQEGAPGADAGAAVEVADAGAVTEADGGALADAGELPAVLEVAEEPPELPAPSEEEVAAEAEAKVKEAVEADRVARQARDAVLERHLTEIFARVDAWRGVEARVEAGVVVLSGQVPAQAEREAVAGVAAKLPGVLYVDNRTEAAVEVAERISPALARFQALMRSVVEAAPLWGLGLLILALFWFVSGVLARWELPYRRLDHRPLLQSLVQRMVRSGVFLVGVLLTLELLDLTALVGAVLGTAGVAGLALGFAFRDIVENYLASLILSLRQPFRKGDVIEVDGRTGKVIRMTTRDTVLMTFEGNHLRIPNAQVFKGTLTNYTLNPLRRFDFVVGVSPAENIIEAQEMGLEVLRGLDGVLADPAPFMLIDDLGDWAVLCHFYGWVDQTTHALFSTRTEAIRRVKVAFDQADIQMPEPTYRLDLLQPTLQAPGDAPAPPARKSLSEPLEDASIQRLSAEDVQLESQIEADVQESRETDLLS